MFKYILSLFNKKPKGELECPHGCGIPLKHHAWSDCGDAQAVSHTMSRPPSAKAKAFYDSVGPNSLHGADGATGPRGGGGGGCSD